MSLFDAVGIALTGLLSQQQALETTGHNIANVNTKGYHRQQAVLRASPPMPPLGMIGSQVGGMYGTGVEVVEVRRLQDGYQDMQLRTVSAQVGRWSMSKDALSQIETYLSPGQGLDLSTMLDRFFSAWQNLATKPEDLGSRQLVRSEAINLATALNNTVAQLDAISSQLDQQLSDKTDRLNVLGAQLATLNAQIGMARAEGREANDLLDQRGLILDEMSQIGGVSMMADDALQSVTSIGGRAFVSGSVVYPLEVKIGPAGNQIVWESDGAVANFTGGEITGITEARDTIIPRYRQHLDDLASALISEVNLLHAQGVTLAGAPANTFNFFDGTTAGTIQVSSTIQADARNISATRVAGAVGDGSLANEIFRMSSTQLIGNQTLNQFAQSLLGQIGNDVRNADTVLQSAKALQEQLSTQQQQVSGVSLDEEMTNMLQYQRAYDASARVLRAADEMIQTLLERLG